MNAPVRAARIGRAVAEMSEMTGALLALARAQEGIPTPVAAYDVGHAVRELVERYRALFSQAGAIAASGLRRTAADGRPGGTVDGTSATCCATRSASPARARSRCI